jgi:hypothetical protein
MPEKTKGAIKDRQFQRHWQHWAHKTQDKNKTKQNKTKQKHNTKKPTKMISNMDPPKNWG